MHLKYHLSHPLYTLNGSMSNKEAIEADHVVTSVEPNSNEIITIFIPTSYHYGKNLETESLEVEIVGYFDDTSDVKSRFSILGKIEKEGSEINNQNDLVDALVISDEELLEQAISEAILKHHTQYGIIGGTAFESHISLGIEVSESRNETIVYALVLYYALSASETGIETHSGSHIPCRITFSKEVDNTYELVEYWEPRGGGLYGSDIRDGFPDDIENEAMDTQKYIVRQIQSCYGQAVELLDIDTDRVINGLLEVIMSSPMVLSNPGDYIDAHSIEYRELTYYGEYMIAFIEKEQEQGGTGLRSRILEILYDDITM